MDLRHPYSDPSARVQLLYRLPTAPAPRRLLVVAESPELRSEVAAGWGSGEVMACDSAGFLRLATERSDCFDAVALPSTLSARAASRGIRNGHLLRAACRLLTPGGVVVGHLEHARALRRLKRPSAVVQLIAAAFDGDAICGPTGCCRLLRQAGLAAGECYYVQPHMHSPMGLVPSEAAAARAHFLRAVRSARHHWRASGHVVRLALCWAGLGGMLQGELFFWARRPC